LTFADLYKPHLLDLNVNFGISPPILYVTSFTESMYLATGARLVESFRSTAAEGALLLCPECFKTPIPPDVTNQIYIKALDDSQLLKNWLAVNADIIPASLGGTAQRCTCPEPDNAAATHARGCPYGWFNKNASRWFRKLIALNMAMAVKGARYVIWLDSDCYFKKRVTTDVVTQWFNGSSVFFHKGRQRGVIESGVIGFDLAFGGGQLIEKTMLRYLSGEFRKDLRWDDGFQFQLALRDYPEIAAIDLATTASGPFRDVVAHSPVGGYIAHEKGVHRFTLGLMS
jgi:hypothetical protein